MNNKFIILVFLVITLGCKSDNEMEDNSLMLKGTVYYYFDPGFGFSSCSFVFEADNDQIYIIWGTGGLREISGEIDEINGLDLELTFHLIEATAEDFQCLHKGEWLPDETTYVEVEAFQKL